MSGSAKFSELEQEEDYWTRAMSSVQAVRKGYLAKCPQKALNPFKQKWQTRWFVLYGDSQHGRVRLEYYDNEKAWQSEKGKRVIPLNSCVSIKPVWNKDYNHVLEIVTNDRTIYLAASSKDEEKLWFREFCKLVFGTSDRNSLVQVVEKRSVDHSCGTDSLRPLHTVREDHELRNSRDGISSGAPSVVSGAGTGDNLSVGAIHGSQGTLQKALTSSVASELSSLVSFESGFDDASSSASTITDTPTSYPVTVRPTIASQKANMAGTYLLQVNPFSIVLIDIPSQSPIAEWPIQYLRRYGRGRTKFSFEAGDKCRHGKGVYTFNTLEGDAIFLQVDTFARGISVRNQHHQRRTTMPDGFKPITSASKKLHRSEGKLTDKFPDAAAIVQSNARFGESVNDMLTLNPGDSVSQSGTLRRDLQSIEEAQSKDPSVRHDALPVYGEAELKERGISIDSDLSDRGFSIASTVSEGVNSIGSAISMEVVQNISAADEGLAQPRSPLMSISAFKRAEMKRLSEAQKSDMLDSSIEEESLVMHLHAEGALRPRTPADLEPLSLVDRFIASRPRDLVADLLPTVVVGESKHGNAENADCLGDSLGVGNAGQSAYGASGDQVPGDAKESRSTSMKRSSSVTRNGSVKRSESLKTGNVVIRNDSKGRGDAVVKKSNLVKRSSSFRSRFFKSKSTEEDKGLKAEKKKNREKEESRSEQTLTSSSGSSLDELESSGETRRKTRDVLAKTADDVARSSENEYSNDATSEKSSKKRSVRRPQRHKSNEMLTPDTRPVVALRTPSSFAGYDYKGHAALVRTSSVEKEEDELRLQQRTLSVMRKVELYEGLSQKAEESRSNSYTFWRRKQSVREKSSKS